MVKKSIFRIVCFFNSISNSKGESNKIWNRFLNPFKIPESNFLFPLKSISPVSSNNAHNNRTTHTIYKRLSSDVTYLRNHKVMKSQTMNYKGSKRKRKQSTIDKQRKQRKRLFTVNIVTVNNAYCGAASGTSKHHERDSGIIN